MRGRVLIGSLGLSLLVLGVFIQSALFASPADRAKMTAEEKKQDDVWRAWRALASLLDIELDEKIKHTEDAAARKRIAEEIRTKAMEAIKNNSRLVRKMDFFDGGTPLTFVAVINDLELAKLLIDQGADVNPRNRPIISSTPFNQAINQGNKEMVEFLIVNGASVNAVRESDTPPLFLATRNCDTQIASMLLDSGADPKQDNSMGKSLLRVAAEQQDFAMIQLLSIFGARFDLFGAVEMEDLALVQKLIREAPKEIDARDGEKNTPLHLAASKDNLKIVAALIENRANVNVRNESGETPLHTATSSGRLEVARYLIEHGAKIDAKGDFAFAPMRVAAADGRLDLVKLFVDKGVNVRGRPGGVYLLEACREGHVEVAEYLISKGADVNAHSAEMQGTGWVGETPLHWASDNGDLALAQTLVKNGAKVNAKNGEGETPLHKAAGGMRKELVEFLLEQGAEVGAKDKDGSTPLHAAVQRRAEGTEDKKEIIEILLKHGADINSQSQDFFGNNILKASIFEDKEITALLLEQGAKTDFFDEIHLNRVVNVEKMLKDNPKLANQKSALHGLPIEAAILVCKPEILGLLLDHGASLDVTIEQDREFTPLEYAVIHCDAKAIEMLLDHGAEVNGQDDTKETALFWAARKDQREIISTLLRRGADANSRSEYGAPIHEAAKEGYKESVKLLLDGGADLELRDKYGKTALNWAARRGHLEVVTFLLERGANPNATDEDGLTPICDAAWQGHRKIIDALIKGGARYGIVEQVAANDLAGVKAAVEKSPDALNAIDVSNGALLHTAAAFGSLEVAKYLVERGANPEAKGGKHGRTLLHDAAENGWEDLIKLLLEKGANIDAVDDDGNTPLHLAGMKCQSSATRLLLDRGADRTIKNKEQKTAADVTSCY